MEPDDGILALAGDGDVFAAAGTAAIFVFLRYRAGDFVRVNPAIGRGQREIARLTIGLGGMGAALLAPGKTLVDPIAVGLVGDDENPAVGQRGLCGKKRGAGQKR